MTVRSSRYVPHVAPHKYTTEELTEAQRLDDLADAEFEARRPEREAAEAEARARSAAYYARVGTYVPPPEESKLVLLPGLGGLGYERQGALWRFVVEGRTVGPHFKTKRALLADARRYAADYGLTVDDDAGATGASGNRARVTLSTSASGWRGLSRGRSLAGFDQKELRRGTEVEREHVGGVTSLARRIAADHLTEDPRYYAKLAKTEAHRAGRDRAVPRSARRFAPSREFLVVVGTGRAADTVAVVAREPSLSRAREVARREADRWGMPADVLDDGWHLVTTYAPGSHRAGAPKRLSHDRCANRCGCSPSGARRSTPVGRRG